MAIAKVLSQFEIGRVDMTGSYIDMFSGGGEESHRRNIPEFDFSGFRKTYEDTIVYFNADYFAKGCSLASCILQIILSPKYRNGSLETIKLDKYGTQFLAKIEDRIAANEPIDFMMPAFPFKIKNPLKSSRGDADLAEIASFLKFHEIALQIKKIYAPGAVFHVFHDGHLYYEAFGHTLEDADRYLHSMREFIKKLGISQSVTIYDAKLALEQHFPLWEEKCKESFQEMKFLRDIEPDNARVIKIKEASMNNINLAKYDIAVLYRINCLPDSELLEEERNIKNEIRLAADACAFDYMVLQHTLEMLNFFPTMIPTGIRLTVHPKEGHIGIYLVKKKTYLLPWMGVGAIKKNGELTVRYESDVGFNSSFEKVYVDDDTMPFYYQEI